MADRTSIAWTDATWNPIRGCTRVSEGCRHCYAEAVAARFSGPGQPYEGLATRSPARWTGQVRLVEEHLADPLRWTRPRRIFVNSMSDLFHEAVTDETIDRVFAVMALAGQHTFQVLTKRPERMREYLRYVCEWSDAAPRVGAVMARITGDVDHGFPRPEDVSSEQAWPLPNVWLGVSVEDQASADERIPVLRAVPAVVRFLSVEPLLEQVHVGLTPGAEVSGNEGADRGIHWAIVGGESGPGARPCDVQWVRSIRDQCVEASVPVFVKQLGAVSIDSKVKVHLADGDWPTGTKFRRPPMDSDVIGLKDRKGADPGEWPEDLRVQQFPSTPLAEGSR